MFTVLRCSGAVGLLLVLAACGGGDGGGTPTHELKLIKWTPSGDNQVDTVGQTLPLVIRVKVTLDGEPTEGSTVEFSGGVLGTTSMITGPTGIATSTWTLAPSAGVQEVSASVTGAVGSPVIFHANAIAGPAKEIVMAGGDGQARTTGNIFLAPFSVQVIDTFGNGVAGRYVHWSSTGPVTLPADSVITNATGFSKIFGTAGGSTGPITVTATLDPLQGSPVEFTGAVITAPVIVTVGNNFFNPADLNIGAGTAVQWNWSGSNHSVSSTDFAGSDIQNAGATWGPVLFNTPGTYTYQCVVHPAMQGTITVN